ncbi:hypothetical protein AMJ49_00535 [Parcubacteria bacterium DG_74_2]|nr:MAG: hypothetical protein AMJ49_00535 [Parcubacteria bacterium DG_74_2]
MTKNFLFALSVLIGLTIGAGIFGIPYTISKSGLIVGLFYFFLLGGLTLTLHLFLGEIVLRTKERHRLVGYAQKYLGKKGKILISICAILSGIGVLLAYLILGGNFLEIIFSPFFNLKASEFSLFFWLVLSIFVFLGMKFVALLEVFTNASFIFIIFLIFFFSLNKFEFSNFPLFNLNHIFLPYGVILFSLFGLEAIPEAVDILKTPQEKKDLKKIMILTTIIVILVYLLFSFSVVSVTGAFTSSDALSGLVPFLGKKIILLGALSALITLADSFLILAIYLKNTFFYDFKITKIVASSISCGLPLILFLSGFQNFIQVISFVGAFFGLIQGILIIFLFKKAKILGDREPEYSLKVPNPFLYFLIIVLILGAISQIFYEIYR